MLFFWKNSEWNCNFGRWKIHFGGRSFWKPINRQRALGGGWGGGGPNPPLPSNVVPQCTTCTTLNQDLPSGIAHSRTKWSLKISWKKCTLEVRRVFETKQEMASDWKWEKSLPKTDMRNKQLSKYLLYFDWLTALNCNLIGWKQWTGTVGKTWKTL